MSEFEIGFLIGVLSCLALLGFLWLFADRQVKNEEEKEAQS